MVGLFGFFVAAIAMYFALGMPGMNHGTGTTMSSMDPDTTMPGGNFVDNTSTPEQKSAQANQVEASGVAELVTPAVFEDRRRKGGVLLNVHVPYDGEIRGTKLSVAYNEIESRKADLPQDLDTPLLVYCRSGRMSAIAGSELLRMGYRNVTDLRGGMLAWRADGRTLLSSFGGVTLP